MVKKEYNILAENLKFPEGPIYMNDGSIILVSFLPWKKISSGSKNNPRKTKNGKAIGGISLKEAIYAKTFWGFFFIFCFTEIGIFGISLHVVAYLVFVGLSEVEAAFSFGIAGILNFVGMVLTGWQLTGIQDILLLQ